MRSEVLADEPPEKIPASEGNLISEIYIDFEPYPEFDNYQLMDEVALNNIEGKKEGFFAKVGTFFKKVGKEMEETAKKVSEKFKEIDFKDKIKTTGSKAYIVLKKAGGFVILKSAPVVEALKEKTKEGLDIISDKAKEGAQKFSIKTKEIYSDLKTKITKKGEKDSGNIGEVPVSDYYELRSQVEINHNQNIVNFINEEKQICRDSSDNRVKENVTHAEQRNSFTLLDDSISKSQEEGKFINIYL